MQLCCRYSVCNLSATQLQQTHFSFATRCRLVADNSESMSATLAATSMQHHAHHTHHARLKVKNMQFYFYKSEILRVSSKTHGRPVKPCYKKYGADAHLGKGIGTWLKVHLELLWETYQCPDTNTVRTARDASGDQPQEE